MGGFGSGSRFRDKRRQVNECTSIDVRKWQKLDLLTSGNILTFSDGLRVEVFRNEVIVERGCFFEELNRFTRNSMTIQLGRRVRHFGGSQPIFYCPDCDKSAFILYLSGGKYRCRTCSKLSYESQHLPTPLRLIVKANRLLAKIDPDACFLLPTPPKPRGMHHATYWKKIGEVEQIKHIVMPFFIEQREALNTNLDSHMPADEVMAWEYENLDYQSLL